MNREQYLQQWAHIIIANSKSGRLGGGKPISILKAETIAGPRAGAVEFLCGNLDGGRLLATLRRKDHAALVEQCPWDPPGKCQAVMAGRWVRVEAPWRDDLATTTIRLSQVSRKPARDGMWVAGISEVGDTILPRLDDATSQFLFGGTTGSGKSVALKTALIQLSADPTNQIVLCDGKMGEGLKALERLPGVVGPCAITLRDMRAALGWSIKEMLRRYAAGQHQGRLIVVFDEFQEAVEDKMIVRLLHKGTAQGRGAGAHWMLATQHPDLACFGNPQTRRNLTGRYVLAVVDSDASGVVVGSNSPRADWLQGQGDCYVLNVLNKGPRPHRVQGCFVDQSDIDAAIAQANGRAGQWQFQEWPEFDPMMLGQDLSEAEVSRHAGNTAKQWTSAELTAALVAAVEGSGRDAMCDYAHDTLAIEIGSTRGRDLVKVGKEVHTALHACGYDLKASEAGRLAGSAPSPTEK